MEEVLPKCINRNQATNICISDECGHPNPFICGNCQYMQLHRNCIYPGWNNIKQRIEKTRKLNHPEFIKHSSAIEQTIQKSIRYLQKQLQYFNMWKSTLGMSADAVNLFKCIQDNQEHKFSGKQVAQILKDIKTQKKMKNYNEEDIKQKIKVVLNNIEQTQRMIIEMYSVLDVLQVNVEKVPLIKIKQKKTQDELKKSYVCNERHPLQFIGNQNLEFVVINCTNCEIQGRVCRSICYSCKNKKYESQGFTYCCLCRPPLITRQMCPLKHKFKIRKHNLQSISCDFCSIVIAQIGNYCQNDLICDYALCLNCYNKLPKEKNQYIYQLEVAQENDDDDDYVIKD